MGKITKRKDGRYVATLMINKKRRYIYGDTRRECAANVEEEKQKGAIRANAPKTMSLLLDRWLDMLTGKRKDTTVEGYRQLIKAHIAPHIGRYAPCDLTVDHVQDIVDAATQTLSPNSTRNVRACLRTALNYAIKRGYVTRNVAQFVDMPTISKRRVTPFSVDQARALLAVVKGHRLEVLYHMALVLGMREGELVAILCEDVDLRAKVIRITGTLRRVKGQLVRTTPKTQNSYNTMPLPDSLVDMLRPMLRPTGYLFVTSKNTPYEPRAVYRHFDEQARVAANKILPPDERISDSATFHTLRHSTASFMIANGTHPRAVMEHLRHSQISVTMDTYGHLMDGEHRRETDKIAELFI